MRQGVDFAAGTGDPKALKAAGKTFVARYLSRLPWKVIREGEAKVLRANGIDVVTVFEDSANRALDGEKAGIEDARFALQQLHDLGAPAGAPVYFAVDFDAQPGQLAAIRAYFHGAASVLGVNRVGVYAGIHVVKDILDHKLARYGWQTYAWSGGAWDPRAHIRQYKNGVHVAGLDTDLDEEFGSDFGQWDRPRPKPKPAHPWPKKLPAWLWKFIAWRQKRLAANRKGKV